MFMNKISKNLALLFLFFMFFSCNNEKPVRSFYLWKANQSISEKDNEFLKANRINKLYLRYFDVDWQGGYGAVPSSILNFSGKIDSSFQIIPVVYIKNRSLVRSKIKTMPDLADKIIFKINEIHEKYFSRFTMSEIQLDCDWTDMSRNNFFKLTELIKQKYKGITISVTIRLHQIKYQLRTGVPPADKGVLMYYNMGEFKNPNEKNSILNNEIGKQYINKHSYYPLELSLALPIYSWSVWVRRGKFKALNYSINSKNITKFTFLKHQKNNVYMVVKDTVYKNEYLRYGDIFKLEETTIEEINEAKKICNLLPNINSEKILFSYSPDNTNLINKHDLDIIFE